MKLLKSFISISIITLQTLTLSAGNYKPYGLLTDLIEHTDRTWQNGYLSNVPVWDIENAIEPLQYVQIASYKPTFSWIVPGKAENTKQTTYRIMVFDSFPDDSSDKGIIWDSGTIESKQSTSVTYKGNALQPDKTYFWKVRLTTNTGGESDWSDIKAFRTASKLSGYASGFYPQIKTLQHPVSIKKLSQETTMIDFGKDAFAQLLLTLSSECDNDSIIIHLGEQIKGNRVDCKPEGTIRYQQYPLLLNKGTHTYRIKIRADKLNTRKVAIHMPDYIGEVLPYRYCEIDKYSKPLSKTDIARESVHYPFDDSASYFQCSNDTLNQIWDLCKYSIKATSFTGIYIDGDRERIPYEADALINQLCHYGVDREYSMARRSHEYLLQFPTWPTEWILQSVLIAWYDYMYTGDSRSLKSNYNILKARTLLQLREKNGLISTTTNLQTPEFLSSINRNNEKIRDIVDWPHTGILGLNKHEGGEADGFVFTDYNTVTNAFHYKTLKLMAKIAKALNFNSEAVYFNKEANTFLTRFNDTFLNKKYGYYVDGNTTDHSSLHSNMFPVAFGMVPDNKINKVVDFIHSRKMACSVYGSQFLMDALYEASDAEYALTMLTKTDDRSWYNMIRIGSTISLEAWDNKYKPNQDWNHAWGAVPANIIPRKLMGVEPLLPGFDKVRIKPQIAFLKCAKAKIPTIKGSINLYIENKTSEYLMQITIPANMESEVYLPRLAKKYEIEINGNRQKTTEMKNAPFISLGDIPSGTYTIRMIYQ
ncbi:alpha-L-rhamnosidase C-terminal domain-containing protein [Prevotella sp. 10(H)]|uniref:alpha-L-rhamnosidase-related protein n=1 Tax=Prevotella sp. 10(H) TaxID=1158294 RepID=UPI00068C7A4B|nr:alpha-L-rhamnosidase C-terminal domain-containing protein [Prevotella sp. 10(H)]